MQKTKVMTSVAMLSLMVTSVAQAADTATASTSASADTNSTLQFIKEKVALKYEGAYTGPGISEPFKSLELNPATGQANEAAPINMEHLLHIGYKITPQITASIVPGYTSRARGESSVTMMSARLAHSSILKFNNVNVAADIRAYPGITNDLKDDNIGLYLRSNQVTSISIPDSRLGLGLVTQIRHYTYSGSKDSSDGLRNLSLRATPYGEYQLMSNLSANLSYEISGNHMKGAKTLDLHDGVGYAEIGLSYDMIPGLNFNPYVDIYTGNNKANGANVMQLGGVLSYKFL